MALSCCTASPASHSFSTDNSSLPKFIFHSRSPPPPPHHPLASQSFPAKRYISGHNNNNRGLEKWRANVSFFPSIFNNKAKNAKILKEELLQAIDPLDRGAEATPEDQQKVDQIFMGALKAARSSEEEEEKLAIAEVHKSLALPEIDSVAFVAADWFWPLQEAVETELITEENVSCLVQMV